MAKSAFTASSLPSLDGKVFIVTGGNAGIGKETVIGLASHGARVYMGARSQKKADEAIQDIHRAHPKADVRFLEINLSSLASVVAAAKQFAAKETKLNGLVNNAGIMATAYKMTADGFESQFQVNYLSHWLLVYHLLPLLQRTAAEAVAQGQPAGAARIAILSSQGHSMYAPKEGIRFADTAMEKEVSMTRYGQSKLANVLHAKQLNLLYGPGATKAGGAPAPTEVWTAAIHPGVIKTELVNKAEGMWNGPARRIVSALGGTFGLFADASKGAQSSLWVAASPDFPRTASGSYVVPTAKLEAPSELAQDAKLAAELWTWTEDKMQKAGFLEK